LRLTITAAAIIQPTAFKYFKLSSVSLESQLSCTHSFAI